MRKSDAGLIRDMVRALLNPEQREEACALSRDRFGNGKTKGLKALLAAAPLEGIDLHRDRDLGRDIDL